MKYTLIIFFLLSQHVYSQKIFWKEGNALSWANFKSKINTQKGQNVVAYTHCGWVYSYVKSSNPKSQIQVKIETIFDEDKSWKDVKRINNYVLEHEQKHFDIAEIFARKLRKEVSEKILTNADFDKYFQEIYNRITKEYRNFQHSYDNETKNGTNEEKQAEYNRIVAEELEKFKNYSIS
ncbi:DUF922 domain-containing protein [Chryseobacterium nematophagum]|uniref:DUF922 domain-containing protein n=1 Tax=Chryseobacterium nematophagum TaxID=2305228 RepID=A0A3M7TH90_9FLAO|nr:DUF922 domain-containing protein [Chryseobacterium nematophagum]RNA62267.1 DUF922 domain-containing protein [Chryseobacterium nematophagum]